MNRKKFLVKSTIGLGALVALPISTTSCNQDVENEPVIDPNACNVSPTETDGPFPNKTPAQLVRENIVGNRSGIPLVINIKVENVNNDCQPLEGIIVDLWQCDSKGNYSQYGGQLDGNLTGENFLRGRQTTNTQGIASFVSLYPGWYPGRAPHLHFEILDGNGRSLLITQTAFPEEISKAVYATSEYKGDFDTSNTRDGEFRNSLNRNIADSITGDLNDGYILNETIKVSA